MITKSLTEKFRRQKELIKTGDIPLESENLKLFYRKKKILQGVSFFAEKNKITVLLGKNGSGKTSLLRCLSGIRRYDEGEIKLFGVPLKKIKRTARAKVISFMPQYLPQLHVTVRELVAMGRTPYHGLSAKLGVTDLKKISFAVASTDIGKHLDEAVCTLSGGERQLAFLAMTLSADSEIILLDEPTASLDVDYRRKVYELIKKLKEYGKTLIVTIHNLDEAMSIADNVAVIDNGEIVFTGNKSDFLRSDVAERIFSLRPARFHGDDGEEIVVFRPL